MNWLQDNRKRSDYEVSELLTACIAMFLFKETSRNALNNDRKEGYFKENYLRVFKLRLPHMDTVEDFLRIVKPEELEALKAALIAGLIEQKVLRSLRLLSKYYAVAIDGTGTNSYTQNDDQGNRTHKTSKNGKVTYHYHVVEAKLVTNTGLVISLASEWITNEADRNFDKQDCEQRAFERLAEKLKRYFPRLPICILADGLYPNKTFMQICQNNNWTYIVVLKDDNLKILQQDITDTENKHRRSIEYYNTTAKVRTHKKQQYKFIDLPFCHSTHTLYWFSCQETITRYNKDKQPLKKQDTPCTFVWLTNIEVTQNNVRELAQTGRSRWKIENEGFNAQKNDGFALEHAFSQNETAAKVFYFLLQIAHLLFQLIERGSLLKQVLRDGCGSAKNLARRLLEAWRNCLLHTNVIDLRTHRRFQIRFDTS